jgi:aspartyl-tRNA(Asn)/glutamyl-tRNA(Gln) amidotransferase subunit A
MRQAPTLDDAHARPLDALEACLERIAALNGKLNAVLDLAPGARGEAEAAQARRDAGKSLSRMDGVPVLVKANIAIAGLPCHAGIGAYRNEIAGGDSEAVAHLRASGAVILGTLNMEEGALGAVTDNPHFGRTFNPWGEGLTPGGSSGGSGAAAAAGFAPVTLGTDTMGSVRIPAAYCGISGHKPSRGAISTQGVIALSHALDHVGPLAARAGDLAPAFSALSGIPLPAHAKPLEGMMIGRWRIELETDVPGEIMRAFEGALETLRALGARIVDTRLRRYAFGKTRREGLLISEYEGHAIHAQALEETPGGFSPGFTKMLAWGATQSEARYREALTALDLCGVEAAQTFSEVDFVVSPTALEAAFAFGDPVPAGQADLTAFANFAGIPATSVPMGLSADGLPLGLQIMAGAGRDYAAMALAAAFEARRGPLKPG